MSDQPNFTGSESAAEIAKAAIDWFSHQPHDAIFSIFYEDSIPKMKYTFDGGWVEFDCVYRLDKMLEAFYSDAERIFNENVRVGFVEPELREMLVPVIAFAGMTAILSRLLILQGQIFLETFDEIAVTTSGMFLHSLVAQNPHKASLGRGASKVIGDWIDQAVEAAMKKKRAFLAGYMNTHPLLNIPTGVVGRPTGSKKPEEKKAQENAEFEDRIEQTIRRLWIENGEEPTKTAVAEAMNIGSSEYRLTSFINRLTRRGINYQAIVDRVRRSLENPT